MMRILHVVSLAALAAACSGPDGARQQAARPASLEGVVSRPAAWAQGGAAAMATLPSGAGAVAQVRERAYANGFGQEIALQDAAKGLNRVEVTVATQAGSGGSNDAPMAKPSEAGVKAEIAARFPGVPMQVVAQPRANAYGPYGIAVGRQSGAVRCLYAWQWIDNLSAAQGAAAAGQTTPASVRVRLCRSDATLDQLASYVDQLTIDPARASSPATLESSAPPPAGGPAARGRRARTSTAGERSARPASARQPGRAAEPASPQLADVGAAASTTERADGRRYLASVQAAHSPPAASAAALDWARIGRPPSGGSAAVASSGPAPAASAKKPAALDSSLPKRAYLGPGSVATGKPGAPSEASAPASPAQSGR